MDFFDDELNNVLNIFQQESIEIIQSMNDCLNALYENNQDEESVLKLFRLAHSLKGSARMMGFNNIQTLAHRMEDVIGFLKDKKAKVTNDIINLLSQTTEYILFLINKTAEKKEEYVTEEINSYIKCLENTGEEKTDNLEKNKIFTKIKALVTEIILYYFKFKNDRETSYINEFRIKLVELKNLFRENNFEDEINSLNNTLGVVCKNEENFKKEQQFDEKLFIFIESIENLCSKNGIEKENFLEIAKKQYEEINKTQNINENVQNLEIKKIRDDLNQDVLNLIKEINNDVEDLKSNPNMLEKINQKIDVISRETSFFEIKTLFNKVKKILNLCVTKSSYPQNNIDILKQLILDSIDVIEDSSSNKTDFELIENRAKLLEESFEEDLNKINTKKEIEETNKQESVIRQFRGKDWINNIDNGEIKTLRVDSSKLDKLASQVSELIMYRIKNTEHLALFKKFQNDFEEWNKSWHKIGYYLKYYEKRYLTGSNINFDIQSVIMHNRQLISLYEAHSEGCSKMLEFIYKLSKQMQEEDSKLVSLSNEFEAMSKTLRILPLATIFHLFPRMVHNIALDKNKQIDFRIEGSEVSADKKIIEEIKIPLIHILRNSVDHGIEPAEERIKKGKPPVGKVVIKAWIENNRILIDVKDDGRGLDIEKIHEVALKKGLIEDENKNYTNEEIIDFVFYPGFTTEETVTEISGRGLGLDIVREKVSQLDGRINIFSKLDEGTCIRVELPIAMSTINVFVVKENDEYYAIDTSYVSIVTRILSKEIYTQDEKNYFVYNKKIVPIFSLSQILGVEDKKQTTEKNTVMLLEYEGNSIGIIVDKLVGDQEIIQKKLSTPLLNVKSVSGVTTLANGETCLILNIKDLFSYLSKKLLLNITPSDKLLENDKKKNLKVLVTDDSLTIRTLQEKILKNHGYSVETAKNGLEAFEKMKEEKYDFLITDYDMPKMTGMELVKEIRENLKSEIPIVVLTSYEKSTLEEQFASYNILSYIQKNQFDQNELMNIIDEKLLNYDGKNS